MKHKESLQLETFQLGKKMIESAIKLDESLAELLKVEILRLKKLNKMKAPIDDLMKTNQLLKNIIYALTINGEKITNGLELCASAEKELKE